MKSIFCHCAPSKYQPKPFNPDTKQKAFIPHMDVIELAFNGGMTFILILQARKIPRDIF